MMVQIPVFARAYHHFATATYSATALLHRRGDWIAVEDIEQLSALVLEGHDKAIGLELTDLAADGCLTVAPRGGKVAGRSPVERGKRSF
jgi:hypothetical protein